MVREHFLEEAGVVERKGHHRLGRASLLCFRNLLWLKGRLPDLGDKKNIPPADESARPEREDSSLGDKAWGEQDSPPLGSAHVSPRAADRSSPTKL